MPTRPARHKTHFQFLLLVCLFAIGFLPYGTVKAELADFCAGLPRPAYAALEKYASSSDWFEVYEVAPGVWAIYEPFQWQEVISYLIVGTQSALLFDTGNGLGDIKAIVDQLTSKSLTVLNSHSHFDHIGGNHQFDNILSVSTAFSLVNSRGIENDMVTAEASSQALCKGLPEGVSEEDHKIKPYVITRQVAEGDVIDLGSRKLKILRIPGHTDDSIALLDEQAGFLWTGDTFYEGPIWLYFPETDLAAYKASLARLVDLIPHLNALFPAHNTPRATPGLLLDAQRGFNLVLAGKAKPVPTWKGVVTFEFDGFGFLMREGNTTLQRHR